jgi:protein-tyrosine phosphatase
VTYAVVFLILAAYLVGLAVLLGGSAWALLWPAVAFAVVAIGYGGAGPRVFGKRPDGRLRWANLVALLPFFLFTWGVWHLLRLVSREPVWNELAPGVFLGRRVLAHELPPDIGLVIDLTAEFIEPHGVRSGRAYRSLPVLDAGLPDVKRLAELAREAAGFAGRVYVHCAQGHGRTGLFAAAVLLARGAARDAGEAIRLVKAARPNVRLKPAQRRALEQLSVELMPVASDQSAR